jgi:L-asparaginase/Glu-tRNA(Gln) amidotransferase subunit D
VIITGSQDPARLKHSDALYNMDNCLKVHEFLREHGVAEVMLLCGNELIRGAWAEKISDRDSDAYGSFNKRPIVELRNRMVKSWRVAPFALHRSDTIPFLPANVVTHEADIPMQKLTDISPEALARMIKANRISIFTLLGSDTCPDTHAEVLTQAARHGKAVFLRSPFHDAILSTGTYAAGSALAKSRIPQVKGTESFIRAKLNWLWHSLGLESNYQEGLGAILSPRQHQQFYTSMSQNVIGEWD